MTQLVDWNNISVSTLLTNYNIRNILNVIIARCGLHLECQMFHGRVINPKIRQKNSLVLKEKSINVIHKFAAFIKTQTFD